MKCKVTENRGRIKSCMKAIYHGTIWQLTLPDHYTETYPCEHFGVHYIHCTTTPTIRLSKHNTYYSNLILNLSLYPPLRSSCLPSFRRSISDPQNRKSLSYIHLSLYCAPYQIPTEPGKSQISHIRYKANAERSCRPRSQWQYKFPRMIGQKCNPVFSIP